MLLSLSFPNFTFKDRQLYKLRKFTTLINDLIEFEMLDFILVTIIYNSTKYTDKLGQTTFSTKCTLAITTFSTLNKNVRSALLVF